MLQGIVRVSIRFRGVIVALACVLAGCRLVQPAVATGGVPVPPLGVVGLLPPTQAGAFPRSEDHMAHSPETSRFKG